MQVRSGQDTYTLSLSWRSARTRQFKPWEEWMQLDKAFVQFRAHFLLQGPWFPLRGHRFPLQALGSPYGAFWLSNCRSQSPGFVLQKSGGCFKNIHSPSEYLPTWTNYFWTIREVLNGVGADGVGVKFPFLQYKLEKSEEKRKMRRKPKQRRKTRKALQFPNAVVLNAVGRRNTQTRAKERKRAFPRKNCKQPGLKQPGLGTPNWCLPLHTKRLPNRTLLFSNYFR